MPIDTHDISQFFANEEVRRSILRIIRYKTSLDGCDDNSEYGDLQETIMAFVGDLADMYNDHDLPELALILCNNNNDQNNENNYLNNTAIVETRVVPPGAKNTITEENIQDGNLMVNFAGESEYGRFYKKSTYNSLNPKIHPYTRQPITHARTYRAALSGGKRTKKTRRGRKQSRK